MNDVTWSRGLRVPVPQKPREGDRLFQRKLDSFLKRHVGSFDTELRCLCGKANIVDHATAGAVPEKQHHDPDEPMPEIRHDYYCDHCGLTYKSDVIEGRRGYVHKTNA